MGSGEYRWRIGFVLPGAVSSASHWMDIWGAELGWHCEVGRASPRCVWMRCFPPAPSYFGWCLVPFLCGAISLVCSLGHL
jgi:hypothetical protein